MVTGSLLLDLQAVGSLPPQWQRREDLAHAARLVEAQAKDAVRAFKYLTFSLFNGNMWAGFAAYCETMSSRRFYV